MGSHGIQMGFKWDILIYLGIMMDGFDAYSDDNIICGYRNHGE